RPGPRGGPARARLPHRQLPHGGQGGQEGRRGQGLRRAGPFDRGGPGHHLPHRPRDQTADHRRSGHPAPGSGGGQAENKFGVEITLEAPRVPYRESIRKSCKAQGRHKKQTGGHGQFGDVWIQFEPCEGDEIQFAENVFGGSVPKNFFPAVEKGVRQAAEHGVLAGYPMVGMKATLLDGSYHPVDSSEMAFIMAAKLAYKAAIPEAGPVLLEPIGALQAHVPADNTGDIMGEVTKRRGRVLGMNPDEDGMQIVEAEVPMAEMQDFTTFLRQLTQGRGWFTFDFVRYET